MLNFAINSVLRAALAGMKDVRSTNTPAALPKTRKGTNSNRQGEGVQARAQYSSLSTNSKPTVLRLTLESIHCPEASPAAVVSNEDIVLGVEDELQACGLAIPDMNLFRCLGVIIHSPVGHRTAHIHCI